jgi:hypothetical protein
MLELPADWFQQITDVRVSQPAKIFELARTRRQRRCLTDDGMLTIVAADHPARRITAAGADPYAMASRKDYLYRIASCLAADALDGVMATMDVLEELLLLSFICTRNGGAPFLDDKILLASLNRGGLNKCSWELDDPVTSMPASACKHWNLDGAKMLLRIEDDDPDCLKTIIYCRDAINELLEYDLPMFLEPLPVVRTDQGIKVNKDWRSLAAIVGVASDLGSSSSRLWLKLPFCENFELVAGATTLPILVLGGDSQETNNFIAEMKKALASADNVRGVMVGRNVLFSQESPVATAKAIDQIVHHRSANSRDKVHPSQTRGPKN